AGVAPFKVSSQSRHTAAAPSRHDKLLNQLVCAKCFVIAVPASSPSTLCAVCSAPQDLPGASMGGMQAAEPSFRPSPEPAEPDCIRRRILPQTGHIKPVAVVHPAKANFLSSTLATRPA